MIIINVMKHSMYRISTSITICRQIVSVVCHYLINDTALPQYVKTYCLQCDSIDDDIACIHQYMESKGCQVKSVRTLKHGYHTMSVKVVVHEESAPILMGNNFWPEGIQGRECVD